MRYVHNLATGHSGMEVMFRYFEIGIPICFLKVVLSLNFSGLILLTKDEKLRLYSIGYLRVNDLNSEPPKNNPSRPSEENSEGQTSLHLAKASRNLGDT